MIELMAQIHMSEAEVARDLRAVLDKVRQGVEVVVEQDARPVAVIRTPPVPGRSIDECIAIAKARGSQASMDEEFVNDLKEVLNQRTPLDTTRWD